MPRGFFTPKPVSYATGLVYDTAMMEHAATSSHPEAPERIWRIHEELKRRGLAQRCRKIQSRRACFEEIATLHTNSYIKLMSKTAGGSAEAKQLRNQLERQYNSVFLSSGSYNSALLAVGSLIEVLI